MSFVLHALNDTDLFLDVGANVGSYTILACGVAGARGICYEPVPETYQRLMKNLAVNSLLDRTQAFNQGVGDSRSTLRFTEDEGCMNHVLTTAETAGKVIEVTVIALDEELREVPTMMKIDVEGYETMVLKGAERVLTDKTLNFILIELNGSGTRYGFDEEAIISTLKNHGFCPYNYDPWHRKLTRLQEKSNSSGNTLFIRDIEVANQRVQNAPKFHVLDKSL
ncbi:FkbM family methyltransferase [Bythopirellula goksoeyrii]|nr:FkbM family methyltransferase [Bythopirellula goksoeyrii]